MCLWERVCVSVYTLQKYLYQNCFLLVFSTLTHTHKHNDSHFNDLQIVIWQNISCRLFACMLVRVPYAWYKVNNVLQYFWGSRITYESVVFNIQVNVINLILTVAAIYWLESLTYKCCQEARKPAILFIIAATKTEINRRKKSIHKYVWIGTVYQNKQTNIQTNKQTVV